MTLYALVADTRVADVVGNGRSAAVCRIQCKDRIEQVRRDPRDVVEAAAAAVVGCAYL